MERSVVDVGNESDERGRSLSNFEPYDFTFRDVKCASMEGLLQSLKFSDPVKQKEICALSGKSAKFKGKKKKWYKDQMLYWNGEPFSRHSETYRLLLFEAFNAISRNTEFMEKLIETEGAKLIHSMGKSDPTRTILTEQELCIHLERIRDEILKKRK